MSRQQWGHGYHKGLEDATKASSDKRWGIAFKENGQFIHCFEILQNLPDGTLLIQMWDDFSMLTHYNMGNKFGCEYYFTGFHPDLNEVIIDSVKEYNPNTEKEETKLFYTFAAMMAEWARQQKATFGSISPFESVIQICGEESK